MEENKGAIYPALNKSQLANHYNISVRTLNIWLRPFLGYIDKKDDSQTYTPGEIKRIVDKLGEFYK